jgi:hypothetical protein
MAGGMHLPQPVIAAYVIGGAFVVAPDSFQAAAGLALIVHEAMQG